MRVFKYGTTEIGDVKLGLRVYSTTSTCSGKIMVRLWKGYGKVMTIYFAGVD